MNGDHPLYIRYTSEEGRGAYVEHTWSKRHTAKTADGPRTVAGRTGRSTYDYRTIDGRSPDGLRTSSDAIRRKI